MRCDVYAGACPCRMADTDGLRSRDGASGKDGEPNEIAKEEKDPDGAGSNHVQSVTKRETCPPQRPDRP